jgi:hypothetical protein
MRESSFLQTFMLSLSRRTFPAINQDETLLELEKISFIIYPMDSGQDIKEFRPELIPRRGEAIAWLGTLIVDRKPGFILAADPGGASGIGVNRNQSGQLDGPAHSHAAE